MSKEINKTNYESALERVDRAKTISDLEALEHTFDWLYEIHALSGKELYKLNDKISTRMAELEVNPQ